MLEVRAFCPARAVDDLLGVLREYAGDRVVAIQPMADVVRGRDLVELTIDDHDVDDLLDDLAELPLAAEIEVSLTQVESAGRYRFDASGPQQIEQAADEELGLATATHALSRIVRVDTHYVLLMFSAAIIATVGLLSDLPIAIVGAMAISPDLSRLNALAVAAMTRSAALFGRGAMSLTVGMTVAVTTSFVATTLLEIGAKDDALSTVPERLGTFVSTADATTAVVALAAGVASMIVFLTERGRAAVGVGVSITTMPAAVYIGIALADSEWREALGAAWVLALNITFAVAAAIATGVLLHGRVHRRSTHSRERRRHDEVHEP